MYIDKTLKISSKTNGQNGLQLGREGPWDTLYKIDKMSLISKSCLPRVWIAAAKETYKSSEIAD